MQITSISTDPNGSNNPLSTLESSKNITLLKYPDDLGSDTKNHYVKFWIKTIKQGPSTIVGTLSNAFQLSTGAFSANPPTNNSEAVICLYMPDTLDAKYNASYDQLSLTNDMGGAIKGIQYASTVMDSATGKNSASMISALKAAGIAKGAARIPGVSDSFASAVLQSQGFAINPQIQMLYRGVDFRSFQLTFVFTPKSASEAQDVLQIINTFKYHFAPQVLSAENSQNGLFFIPPSFFNIEFMINGQENIFLPRYGDCVLTDIDVNFSPNGFAAHNDGSPVQTQLNLSFRETEIITKDKLYGGIKTTNSGSDTYNTDIGGLR